MSTKIQKLDEFVLKLLAFFFMTIDHIGVFLMIYAGNKDMADAMYLTGYVFKCIGRVAFPLFILMLTEGIRHSNNVWKYILRIAIITAVVMASEMIIYYSYSTAIQDAQSPLIDLLLCAVTLALLKRKDWFSLFAILPIGYILLTTGVQIFELANNVTIYWLPFYIRPGYSILGLGLALAFYYAHASAHHMTRNLAVNHEQFEQTAEFQGLVNALQASYLLVINIVIYLLSTISVNGITIFDLYVSAVETWSIASLIFILMYNGKRGYNKAWFKYGSYLYFPVHIVIIFCIFYLIYR